MLFLLTLFVVGVVLVSGEGAGWEWGGRGGVGEEEGVMFTLEREEGRR